MMECEFPNCKVKSKLYTHRSNIRGFYDLYLCYRHHPLMHKLERIFPTKDIPKKISYKSIEKWIADRMNDLEPNVKVVFT